MKIGSHISKKKGKKFQSTDSSKWSKNTKQDMSICGAQWNVTQPLKH